MVGSVRTDSQARPPSLRRLSSKATFFNKRVVPVVWFGSLAVFVVVGLVVEGRGEDLPMVFFVAPLILAVIGFVIMKMLVFDLLDEVWDAGDGLVVRNGGAEDRVPLTNVINVSHATFTNPPRITLTLRHPCSFGKEITFSPLLRLNPFGRDPIAAELIERVDATRRR